MQTLYVLRGLPASGKTTWAKKKIKENKNIVVVNRDKIREMLKVNYHDFPFGSKMEKLVNDIESTTIHDGLVRGYDVIIDATNFRWSQFDNEYYPKEYNCKVEIIDFTDVPLETCIERDKNRGWGVGEEVLKKMHKKYLAND